jgi:hypothetical protein
MPRRHHVDALSANEGSAGDVSLFFASSASQKIRCPADHAAR